MDKLKDNITINVNGIKIFKCLSRFISGVVLACGPTNEHESEVMYITLWYHMFAAITSELIPGTSNDYMNGVNHSAVVRKQPDLIELAWRTVDAVDEILIAEEYCTIDDAVNSINSQLYDSTAPNFDKYYIDHVTFDAHGRNIKATLTLEN